MLELCLLRHADAAIGQVADFERPLTERGVYEAERVARRLVLAGIRPQLIIASTAMRVRQTLAIIAPALEVGMDSIQFEDLVYEASVDGLLGLLSCIDEGHTRVLLCGHNPAISQLAGRLCHLPSPGFSPCTCALLEFPTADNWKGMDRTEGLLKALYTPATS